MILLSLILSFFVILLGFPIGIALARLAEEELAAGKFFLVLWKDILLLGVAVVLFFSQKSKTIVLSVFILGIVFVLSRKHTRQHLAILYMLVLAVLIINQPFATVYLIIATMFFLYGFPLGSLYVMKRLKGSKVTKKMTKRAE